MLRDCRFNSDVRRSVLKVLGMPRKGSIVGLSHTLSKKLLLLYIFAYALYINLYSICIFARRGFEKIRILYIYKKKKRK